MGGGAAGWGGNTAGIGAIGWVGNTAGGGAAGRGGNTAGGGAAGGNAAGGGAAGDAHLLPPPLKLQEPVVDTAGARPRQLPAPPQRKLPVHAEWLHRLDKSTARDEEDEEEAEAEEEEAEEEEAAAAEEEEEEDKGEEGEARSEGDTEGGTLEEDSLWQRVRKLQARGLRAV